MSLWKWEKPAFALSSVANRLSHMCELNLPVRFSQGFLPCFSLHPHPVFPVKILSVWGEEPTLYIHTD